MKKELHKKLAQLQWLLHKQHHQMHMSSGPLAEPTHGQGRIVAILKIKDGISTKELSYLLGISVSSLNELLLKLEKKEYLTRIPSESDKRVMLIYLTEKGKNSESGSSETDEIFACLSDDEQKEFGLYLDKIIKALFEKLGITESFDKMHELMIKRREEMGEEKFKEMYHIHEKFNMRGHDCKFSHSHFDKCKDMHEKFLDKEKEEE